jgi:hypothetical protein
MLLVFSLTALLLVTLTLPITVVSGQEDQDGEDQQWLTYEDPDFGYTIQYTSDWEELNTINYENTSDKSFRVPERYPWGAFEISIEPLEKYLDTDTLTIKTRTLQDSVVGQIAGINSDPDLELLKNISTTVGQDHYPAVQVQFSERGVLSGDTYWIRTFMVNDGYRYLFSFFAPALDTPKLSPTAEKMLASFQITR